MASMAKIVEVLALVEETYPSTKPASEATEKVWKQIFSKWTDEELEAAFVGHLGDPVRGVYPPKPADLVAARQASQDDQIEAYVATALEKVMNGAYQTYSPHGGSWNLRKMAEELGPDSVAAFLEAGGRAAFDFTESSQFAAKAFAKALRLKSAAGVRSGRLDPARVLAEVTGKSIGEPAKAIKGES